jgi:hypothetical protein
MFNVVDMAVIEVIEQGLENLRQNPHHLRFILGAFSRNQKMIGWHGANYINQCVTLILNQKIHITPGYVNNNAQLPHIAVMTTYDESQQFLGDYGRTDVESSGSEFSPEALSVTILRWVGDREVVVSKKPYIGQYLIHGQDSRVITDCLPDGDYYKCELASDVSPRWMENCFLADALNPLLLEIHTSMNSCNVMIRLKSSGDVEVHKLLCLVLRYCLRYGRYSLENLGVQISRTHQDLPVLEDPDQLIFASAFSMSGTASDSWIVAESRNPSKICLDLSASSTDTEDEDVYLGHTRLQ